MRSDDRIVPADAGMLERIAEMEREIFSDPWPLKSLENCLKNPAFIFLAARDGQGAVCGYLAGSLIPPEGEVCTLAVSPGRRREGIGRALLTAFLQKGVERGAERFFLEVRAGNASAIALYRSCGFIEYGRRKRYYRSPTEDAVLMALEREFV